MFLHLIRLGLCISALLFTVCSTNIAGGGTESTNGKIAVAVNGNDVTVKAPKGTLIAIFDSAYVATSATFSESLVIDNSEKGSFLSLNAGIYNILAWQSDSNKACIFKSIQIPRLSVDTLDLALWGTIEGVVKETSGLAPDSGSVFIQGTPYYSKLSSSGEFRLSKVPPSIVEIEVNTFIKNLMSQNVQIWADSAISLPPGQTRAINFTVSKPD